MKALKALVIFMGILIVAGIGLVVYGLVTQFGKPDDAPVVAGPAVAPPAGNPVPPGAVAGAEAVGRVPAAPFGDVALDQPADSRIVGATVAEGRILLRLSGGGKPDRVVMLKADDGGLLGTISLGAESEASAEAPAQ